MPQIINDDNTISTVDAAGKATSQNKMSMSAYSPKIFHKTVLTGRGGQTQGLLRETRDPKYYKNGYKVAIKDDPAFETTYNGPIKIYSIPFAILPAPIWNEISEFDMPDITKVTQIASKGNERVFLWMPIYAALVQEEQIPGPAGSGITTTSRDLSASMHMFLFYQKDTNSNTFIQQNVNDHCFNTYGRNCFYQDLLGNIFALKQYALALEAHGYTVNRDAMQDFVQNYSLYKEICLAAERWMTEIDYYIVDVLAKNLNKKYGTDPDNHIWKPSKWDCTMSDVLSRLENINVPLDAYQKMYADMKNVLSQDILNIICKANLNLRLSNTLNSMNNKRNMLNCCPNTNHIASPSLPYSSEQRDAIESDSPLTLVQSGAGTGKSTVILGRIDHMMANGIKPEDITVLSFTNAAANHINDLKPNIHSMTIASMMHTIYSTNFPTHQLSSLSTIINSLDIFFNPNIRPMTSQKKRFIDDFRYVLERLRDRNEYTKANNFVEDHVDEVIDALNTIEQTSLEMEAIICYLKMDTLVEPPETKTEHLIIDEVQDNSIAEFIYCIQYTEKHNNSLYIVGDCSQTLFEFRASNPKALNVLEGSNVFKTFKLQTNYRSNQEILDFANVGLSDIEANRYANIQLYANNLSPVTLQTFEEAVHFHYEPMQNRAPQAMQNVITRGITFTTREYIQDKLNKGEQVAILAQRRFTLHEIELTLNKIYPGKSIVSLIPSRQHDSALFSKFIARFWNKITYTPPNNILTTIKDTMMSNLYQLSYGGRANQQKTQQIATNMFDDFEKQYGNAVMYYQRQVGMSVMTQKQMLDEIKKLMIAFEIKRNAIAQALVSSKNNEAKMAQDVANANFILSTIHSAKGLEFDNVVVFHDAEGTNRIEEDIKRMYYVAFTRAKKSEFIYSYGTIGTPKVKSDYDTIIKKLTKKAASAVVQTGASNIHLDDDDDPNANVLPSTADANIQAAFGTDPDNMTGTDPDNLASTETMLLNDDGEEYSTPMDDDDLYSDDPVTDDEPVSETVDAPSAIENTPFRIVTDNDGTDE